MVSKNFLFAPLLCLLLLTGAAKMENGSCIHYRGDRPLDGRKFQVFRLSVGRLGVRFWWASDRTNGVLGSKRDWETK